MSSLVRQGPFGLIPDHYSQLLSPGRRVHLYSSKVAVQFGLYVIWEISTWTSQNYYVFNYAVKKICQDF